MTAALLAVLLTNPAVFPSTGTLVSVNKGEDTVSLIDLRDGKTAKKLPTGPHPQEVVFMKDGKTGVISNMGDGRNTVGKSLTVIDLETQAVIKTIDLGDYGMPHGVIPYDDKKVLMTSHMKDALVMVNVETGKIEKTTLTEGKGTHLVVLSPDRKLAYTANVGTNDVSVIDISEGKVLKRIPCGPRSEGISISPNGKLVAIGNLGDNTVSIIDTEKREVIKTLDSLIVPIRTFFTPDGKHILVSAAGTGEVAVYSSTDFKEAKRVKLIDSKFTLLGGAAPVPMNWERSQDGSMLFLAIINADCVALFDPKKLEVVGSVATGKLVDGVGHSPFKMKR